MTQEIRPWHKQQPKTNVRAAITKLSEDRAKAVKAELVKQGIKDGTLTIKGYGPRQPIEDNKTEDGKWRNRRIQYTVAAK